MGRLGAAASDGVQGKPPNEQAQVRHNQVTERVHPYSFKWKKRISARPSAVVTEAMWPDASVEAVAIICMTAT